MHRRKPKQREQRTELRVVYKYPNESFLNLHLEPKMVPCLKCINMNDFNVHKIIELCPTGGHTEKMILKRKRVQFLKMAA